MFRRQPRTRTKRTRRRARGRQRRHRTHRMRRTGRTTGVLRQIRTVFTNNRNSNTWRTGQHRTRSRTRSTRSRVARFVSRPQGTQDNFTRRIRHTTRRRQGRRRLRGIIIDRNTSSQNQGRIRRGLHNNIRILTTLNSITRINNKRLIRVGIHTTTSTNTRNRRRTSRRYSNNRRFRMSR